MRRADEAKEAAELHSKAQKKNAATRIAENSGNIHFIRLRQVSKLSNSISLLPAKEYYVWSLEKRQKDVHVPKTYFTGIPEALHKK